MNAARSWSALVAKGTGLAVLQSSSLREGARGAKVARRRTCVAAVTCRQTVQTAQQRARNLSACTNANPTKLQLQASGYGNHRFVYQDASESIKRSQLSAMHQHRIPTWFADTLLDRGRHLEERGVLRSRRAGVDGVAFVWAGGGNWGGVAKAARDTGLGVHSRGPAAGRAGCARAVSAAGTCTQGRSHTTDESLCISMLPSQA